MPEDATSPAKIPVTDSKGIPVAPSVADLRAIVPAAFPPEAEKALERVVEEGGPKALMAIFGAFSRTTNFGPDPQTAKVMADVEMHAEDCRLKGFQESLKNRDAQSERDHGYRTKRLNHDTVVQVVTLIGAIVFGGVGLYLFIHDNKQIGGYILFASFFIIYGLVSGAKPPTLPKP